MSTALSSAMVLLVANRGEIAIRILRTASDLGIETIAIHAEDDAESLHTRHADRVLPLAGSGPAAYLDIAQVIGLAQDAGATAIHPGYGFLSENAALAAACAAAGIDFVGPTAETLGSLGDKTQARRLAAELGVPVLPGTEGPVDLDAAHAFYASLPSGASMVLKAVAGGGGRGMREVASRDVLDAAFERAGSEASAAFGRGDLYAEAWLPRTRHVEVQVIGDGTGEVAHLYERECSLQRTHQKIVEIAPCPGIAAGLRARLVDAAVAMAKAVRYRSLGTFEFLVPDPDGSAVGRDDAAFFFIEANPRLQVEHTVTECVLGLDLVALQLRLVQGEGLHDLGVGPDRLGAPNGMAVECRINMERMDAAGRPRPSGGTLAVFDPPGGPGVRVDTFGYAGYTTSPRYDSLLAKVIVHSPGADFETALRRTRRALAEFRIEGVETNLGFLRALLGDPTVRRAELYTRCVEALSLEGALDGSARLEARYFDGRGDASGSDGGSRAGARIDSGDPLAVLEHGKRGASTGRSASPAPAQAKPSSVEAQAGPDGSAPVCAPLQGTVIELSVAVGDTVRAGQQLAVMEAMKMEHVVVASASGVVRALGAAVGDAVFEGHGLIYIEASDAGEAMVAVGAAIDLAHIRPDLEEVRARHAAGQDASRPEAVARRRKTGQRTTRENIEDLCDPDTFNEYGALVIAAQRRRRSVEDLIAATPGDGLVGGIGRVNGGLFGADVASQETRCVLMSYDYTVLAGTQGAQNHRKKDRMFELAERWRLPVVFFTEGGGGRPGDTDALGVAGLDCLAFHYFGRLSGLVPLVGITSGRCFAGNAALLGCCDVVIAAAGSNIGMGGPAMIEGGGLGIFRPEEVGPMDVQVPNGVVDVAVADEAEAVAVARQYLGYFQGAIDAHAHADQRALRHVIPENRLRIYDVREVIRLLFDADSVLELRREFGLGMVTSLARIEGRPVGVIANNPAHLAGAIDSDAADKAARFMQLCDAFDLPIVSLCDTPGIMVGPEAEKRALVRHAARMFVTSASLTVPLMTIVLRKGYGLGAQAMAGGSFKAPVFTVSWPTGEFGGMGLEGAVKLGFRNELAAIEDPTERKALFDTMVERMYAHGKAVNMASHFEIDDVIDPFETRGWILNTLRALPAPPPRTQKKRPCIDTW